MMYLLTSILPLVLATFLIEGRRGFTFNATSFKSLFVHQGVRVYVLITIITPLLLNISSDGFSRNSGSSFKWKFVFLLKNGETEEFGPFAYSKYSLKDSLHIKELLADKKISLTTDQLFAKEWDFVEVDMEFEEDANPEDFYSVFQYNPETKEYYNISYD